MSLPMPEIPRTRTVTESVPDHEVLLVFNGDEEAVQFEEWLTTAGWNAFLAWREKEAEGGNP